MKERFKGDSFLNPKKPFGWMDLEVSCPAPARNDRYFDISQDTSTFSKDFLDRQFVSKLHYLTLTNLAIPWRQFKDFCETLSSSTVLESLSLKRISPECFSRPDIPEIWGSSLGSVVAKCPMLTSLTVQNAHVSLVRLLLQRLCENSGSLLHLNLGMCNLGDSGAFDIAEALPRIRTLRVLEIDDNNIHVAGIHALACGLVGAPNITQLSLEHDITAEIVALSTKSPVLSGQCLTYAGSIAIELSKHCQNVQPLPSDDASKRLSIMESTLRNGWNSMLPRDIRVLSPIVEPLPLAVMPQTEPLSVKTGSKRSKRHNRT